MGQLKDANEKLATLQKRHDRTVQVFWNAEDRVEELEAQEESELKLLEKINKLQRQVATLRRQITRMRSRYHYHSFLF